MRGPLSADLLGLQPSKACADGAMTLSLAADRPRRGVVLMPHHLAFRWSRWPEVALKAPALLFGVAACGTTGTVAARAISVLGMVIFAMGSVRRMTGLSPWRQMCGLSRTVASLTAMAGAMLALRPAAVDGTGPLRLLVETALAGAAGLVVFGEALAGLWELAGRPPGFEALIVQRLRDLAARRLGAPVPRGRSARAADETEDRSWGRQDREALASSSRRWSYPKRPPRWRRS
ncbi:hypothetical protein [Rubrimonas cliftonensis]|uniref:Uncharacterized protein n=1 Tax=Rubrimonas cliftonensis TaxID=89524 RepID=A0A1H4E808_9RHOB|nr:hypothetical protein [Rubrimonas cliftonensis]SEA80700.1 hypothetical protein SAMN05444370_11279 [Rubrimonas cliftonensis]